MSETGTEAPTAVREFAHQAADFIERTVGLRPEFDSETLPLLDHYVRQAETAKAETVVLVAATAGTYFGEVVRRTLGGSWSITDENDPAEWRLVLPGGLSFAPAGFAAAAILRDELDDYDTGFDAPPKMRAFLEELLESLPPVTEEQFFELSSRFDTIEHVQEVMLAYAAQRTEEDIGNN